MCSRLLLKSDAAVSASNSKLHHCNQTRSLGKLSNFMLIHSAPTLFASPVVLSSEFLSSCHITSNQTLPSLSAATCITLTADHPSRPEQRRNTNQHPLQPNSPLATIVAIQPPSPWPSQTRLSLMSATTTETIHPFPTHHLPLFLFHTTPLNPNPTTTPHAPGFAGSAPLPPIRSTTTSHSNGNAGAATSAASVWHGTS